MNTILAVDYYLTNFKSLLRHVYAQYADLLKPEEFAFYNRFFELDTNAQKLLVRLLSRKGNIFRASKLTYTEIESIAASAEALAQQGFIQIGRELALADCLSVINRSECVSLATQHKIPSKKKLNLLSRKELDSLIGNFFESGDKPIILPENIYTLNDRHIFDIFKLLFFGNPKQELTEFVLRDLGIYSYENYRIDAATRLFESREQIQRHIEFFALKQVLRELLDSEAAGNVDALYSFYQRIPASIKCELSLREKLWHIYFLIAQQLERLNALQRAAEIYQISELASARQRLARVLVKQEKIREALTVCDVILMSPRNEEECIFARDFGFRVGKKYGIVREATEKYVPTEVNISIAECDAVEHGAKIYFADYGRCEYVENQLFSCVFGLLYWDVIFASVRGAFTHPFQYRPHDLYSHDFLIKRQKIYEESNSRLADKNTFLNYIVEKWKVKRELMSPFVFWGNVDSELLELAVDRIPLAHWQAIFLRMWADIKANRSGFPDLIVFFDGGGYELIEVKGPGDKLQKNQLRWMHYFNQQEIPHRVCNVTWK